MTKRVPLGRSGLTVPIMGLGCAGLPADDDSVAFRAMAHALDRGIDFFDTADRYGDGRNEETIGRFLKTVERDRVLIGTKFGSIAEGPDGKPAVDNSPAHIARACEASLRRLGIDVIDVYYMHRRDPKVPVAESVGAMARLVEQGKVRALGLSEVAARTLVEADAIHTIAAVQSEYSLWYRGLEEEVLPMCRSLGVAVVPFSPLGRSFLTGTLIKAEFASTDLRATLPRFQAEAIAANLKLVARLEAFAAARQVKRGQIALAWLMSRGDERASVVPIPGTKRPAFIDENLGAADIALDDGECAELEALFAPEAIVGARYSEIEAARAGL